MGRRGRPDPHPAKRAGNAKAHGRPSEPGGAERGGAKNPPGVEEEEGGADQPHPGTRTGRCRCSLPGLTGFTA